MAEPRPSPPREPPAAEASTARAHSPPGAGASAARKALLSPAELPTRLTYVAVAGPSGVKQCFRSVKTVRRIPTLPKKLPKDSDGEPGVAAPRRRAGERSKRHACPACDKQFSSPGKLQQHALAHSGELPFGCGLCDKRFNSKFKLVRHGLIHSEARAFSCPVCSKTFNRKDHLNNHVRVHNPVKKVHRCERPGCRKQYSSLLSYRKHAALHSAEEGCLQCKICSKTFSTRDDIVHHLKVHTGSRSVKSETDKKFSCSYCDRKFFTGKDVRRHLVVHTGRRDFVCQFCPQKFGRKDHLVRHVKNAHVEEAWSAAPGTSAPPKPEPQPDSDAYLDFLEDLFPEEQSSSSVSMPLDDVTIDEVKLEPLEPLEVGGASQEHEFERAQSPQPSTSAAALSPALEPEHYPLYMMPPPQYPLLDMLEPEMLLEAPRQQEGLSSDIMDLIQPGRVSLATEQQTTLPTFTKAFQSTAPSRKPPQPPPQ